METKNTEKQNERPVEVPKTVKVIDRTELDIQKSQKETAIKNNQIVKK